MNPYEPLPTTDELIADLIERFRALRLDIDQLAIDRMPKCDMTWHVLNEVSQWTDGLIHLFDPILPH